MGFQQIEAVIFKPPYPFSFTMSAAIPIDVTTDEFADARLNLQLIKDVTDQEIVVGGEAKGQYIYWMMVFNNPEGALNGEGLGRKLAEHHIIEAEQVVWQNERGREGTLHAQVWVKTKAKHRLNVMKNVMRGRDFKGWVMPCKDPRAARKYCEKVDSRVEGPWYFGTTPQDKVTKKGQRTDIDRAARIIVDGGSIADVIQEAPGMFVKYAAGLMKLEGMMARPRQWMTELHILWGVSDSGKSHTARVEAGGDAYYLSVPKKGQALWWDGYQGQENVVVEDFYGEVDLQTMLKLVDKYPMKIQVKGAMVEFRAKKIWITSNSNWELWYATEFMRVAEHKFAFQRRITTVREFKERYSGRRTDGFLPVDPTEDDCIDLTGIRVGEPEAVVGDDVLVPFDYSINNERVVELSGAERDFLSDIDPVNRVEALNWFRDQ